MKFYMDNRVDSFLKWYQKNVLVPFNKKVLKYRKRKMKIRIDNYDVWNADHTISLVVLPMIKMLKESKNGTPLIDDEDVPERLRSTAASPKKNDWDMDDLGEARWDYVLDEMIYAFECTADLNWEDQFYSGKHDIQWVQVEFEGKTVYKMKTGPEDTFKVDNDGMKASWERRKEGLRLFGKYFHSLWD